MGLTHTHARLATARPTDRSARLDGRVLFSKKVEQFVGDEHCRLYFLITLTFYIAIAVVKYIEFIEEMVSLDEVDSQINLNKVDSVNDCTETGVSNVPIIGMLFDSVDEMFNFYKDYGQVNGFSVKRRSITKDTNGDYRYMIFTCGRLSVDGKWKITLFEDVHNHDLSPNHSRFFVCNREINPSVKRQLEINDIVGIRPNKSYNSFVIGVDGNVFWADLCSRAAYHEFGDVVTFDTTYLTNKYDMSFAPFVSVNHHGHSILLGCDLISSEDTETFVWLVRTWLACMSGVAPHGIITDQDRAMKNAIENVFPNTRYRLCLWHIIKNVPEKLGSHGEYESIKRMLAGAVYHSYSINEFESDFLCYLLSLSIFYFAFVGMSTTGQSESMNAFFDGYVNSKTTLKQFVEQHGNALWKKIEKESQTDFDSPYKQLVCVTKYELEKKIQNTVTHGKFVEF
ncbi:protein FAR-RED IMPAIRED RESPONSE 1-like [Tripterygium wilfordii]|uniref:protein FAR-RED IMPAIRED RESPONSE 1-like n=1 Tax=Tripterygium wilfordii TaxID=458696 RepID=UPI0018F80F60|nr:protein FAR-RED IMPAIRED RESPONSE 1-like [Tripterygium wilfordii]